MATLKYLYCCNESVEIYGNIPWENRNFRTWHKLVKAIKLLDVGVAVKCLTHMFEIMERTKDQNCVEGRRLALSAKDVDRFLPRETEGFKFKTEVFEQDTGRS